MQQSSRMGLLISAFALSTALTVGLATSKATEARTTTPDPPPVYIAPPPVNMSYTLTIDSWQAKRQLFQDMLTDLKSEESLYNLHGVHASCEEQ